MMRIQGTGSDTGDDIVSKSKTDPFLNFENYTFKRVGHGVGLIAQQND